MVCFLLIYVVINVDAQRGFYAEPKLNFTHDTLMDIDQVLQDPSGGYYAVGSIRKDTVTNIEHVSGMLLRFDCQGHLDWCRSISDRFDGGAEYIDKNNSSYGYSKVLPLSNGRVLLLDNYNDNALTIFDNTGKVLVSKKLFYGKDSAAIFWDAKRIPGDRIVISGFSRKYYFDVIMNPFIAVYDNDLNKLWSFTLTDIPFKRYIPDRMYNNICVLDDKIYTLYPLRDSSFVLHCLDFKGNTHFIEKINDGSFVHNIGILPSETSIYVTNIKYITKFQNSLQLFQIDPVTGRIEHSNIIAPNEKTFNFLITPVGTYNNALRQLHFTGYIDTLSGFDYKSGTPYYIVFHPNTSLVSAYKALHFYNSPTLDTKILWKNMPHIDPDEDWSTPSVRFDSLNSVNRLYQLDSASFMISRIPFEAISCIETEDISDALSVRSVPFVQPVPMTEHRINGPMMKEHIVRGSFIHPKVRNICYITPEVKSIIVPDDSIFCPNSYLGFHSFDNPYNTEWYWFVDDHWVGSDSVLTYLFDSTRDYDIRLITGDGCFYDTSSFVLHINPVDTVYSNALLCLGDTLFVGEDSIFEDGDYTLLLQNERGCDSIVYLSVELEDIQIEVDSVLCPGEIRFFHGVSISKDTTVSFTLSSSDLCDSNVTVHFIFVPDCNKCELRMPRAFTPNNDGINDAVGLINPCDMILTEFSFSVFNRWGERVFSTNDYTGKWNGMYNNKHVPSGVYLYSIQAVLPNGSTFKQRGDITLIR